MPKCYYYSCFIHDKRSSWKCEMHDSFVDAHRHVEAFRFLNSYGDFYGTVVSFPSMWPGFVRRILLHFKLFFPIALQDK